MFMFTFPPAYSNQYYLRAPPATSQRYLDDAHHWDAAGPFPSVPRKVLSFSSLRDRSNSLNASTTPNTTRTLRKVLSMAHFRDSNPGRDAINSDNPSSLSSNACGPKSQPRPRSNARPRKFSSLASLRDHAANRSGTKKSNFQRIESRTSTSERDSNSDEGGRPQPESESELTRDMVMDPEARELVRVGDVASPPALLALAPQSVLGMDDVVVRAHVVLFDRWGRFSDSDTDERGVKLTEGLRLSSGLESGMSMTSRQEMVRCLREVEQSILAFGSETAGLKRAYRSFAHKRKVARLERVVSKCLSGVSSSDSCSSDISEATGQLGLTPCHEGCIISKMPGAWVNRVKESSETTPSSFPSSSTRESKESSSIIQSRDLSEKQQPTVESAACSDLVPIQSIYRSQSSFLNEPEHGPDDYSSDKQEREPEIDDSDSEFELAATGSLRSSSLRPASSRDGDCESYLEVLLREHQEKQYYATLLETAHIYPWI